MEVIKAVIFDCFGVLAGKGYKRIYQEAGGDLAKDGDFVTAQLHASNTGEISNAELNRRVAGRIGKTPDAWHSHVQSQEEPNQELLDYIKTLKTYYKIGMLSNAYFGTAKRKFSPDQLALFDEVIVSAEVGMIKPEPAIYRYAAEKLGVEPTECAYIDDLPPYVEGAKAVGMQALRYEDVPQVKRELEKILSAS